MIAGVSLRAFVGTARWYATPTGLASMPSEIMRRYRQWRYFRRATSVGSWLAVTGDPLVSNAGRLMIGDRFRVVARPQRTEISVGPRGELVIGDDVFVNWGASISAQTRVVIGDGCLIGADVMVMDCDYHDPVTKASTTEGAPIVLEDHVWLGNKSIVLKGVTIGRHAVVAAGAVVTKDVPPGVVVAGVPARVVRSL